MKAGVLKSPGNLVVEEVPLPRPAAGEVLIKVIACGICGSDLRYYQGENPWALHTLGEVRENLPNIILGHEFTGEVVETGDPCSSSLMGKRVAVVPFQTCGKCDLCRSGRENLCVNTIHLGHGAGWGKRDYYPGGMAEFCAVWADKVYPLPDSISWEEAIFLDLLGVAVHAVNLAQMPPQAEVAILGTGPVGCGIIAISRLQGATKIYISDIYEKAREMAHLQGADVVIDPERDKVEEIVLGETGGKGVAVVFDTVGSPLTQCQARRMLAPGGVIINLATTTQKVTFPLIELGRERTLKSSSNYLFSEFRTALQLLEEGKIKISSLITHRFSLREINRAFEILRQRKKYQPLKVVIYPHQ